MHILCKIWLIVLALTIVTGAIVKLARPKPLTIICDHRGNYGFIDWDRNPNEEVFTNRQDAVRAIDLSKAWSDDFDRRRKLLWKHRKEMKSKFKGWKECPLK